MATAGRRVLLVDADLRRPQLHQMFSIPKSPGLWDLLLDRVQPSETFLESSVPGLYLLPAGADVTSPNDALDSQRLSRLIDRFGEDFDVVVLDCPPVMPVADATIIANAATSVLFVVVPA
jgi:Mrp family chromosome partitioning ATPase